MRNERRRIRRSLRCRAALSRRSRAPTTGVANDGHGFSPITQPSGATRRLLEICLPRHYDSESMGGRVHRRVHAVVDEPRPPRARGGRLEGGPAGGGGHGPWISVLFADREFEAWSPAGVASAARRAAASGSLCV